MESGPISVLELFSGIGGMHAALSEIGHSFKIVGSYEINSTALAIYQRNFTKVHEKNIMGMNPETVKKLQADLIVMSPPCQPFTRQGLKKDTNDTRCSPFLHVLSLLEEVQVPPPCILLENVAGFESSEAHTMLINVLKRKEYSYQEFLLTPSQLGIPNSRLRYYLIAKKLTRKFKFPVSQEIQTAVPICSCYHSILTTSEKMPEKCLSCSKVICTSVSQLIKRQFFRYKDKILSNPFSLDKFNLSLSVFLEALSDPNPYLVKKRDILKYAKVFDVVGPNSNGSCCFTKGYGHFVQGTGSVIQHNDKVDFHMVYKNLDSLNERDKEAALSSLQLRYFTPREILNLLCFPDRFKIDDSFTPKQSYRVLGNSINVFIVSLLLLLLIE